MTFALDGAGMPTTSMDVETGDDLVDVIAMAVDGSDRWGRPGTCVGVEGMV